MKGQVTRIVGAPIPYVFDAVCVEATQQAAYDLLAPGGTLALVTQNLVKEDETSQKKILMIYGSHLPENRAIEAKFAAALTRWLAEGKIKVRDVVDDDVQKTAWLTRALDLQPNPVQVLPGGLNGIADGLKILEKSGVSAKKLVVRPHETRA